jgi:hypothetical protein
MLYLSFYDKDPEPLRLRLPIIGRIVRDARAGKIRVPSIRHLLIYPVS